MLKSIQKSLVSLLILCVFIKNAKATVIDCQRPPQLVDPAHCCRDGGRDEITEKCALRMGVTGKPTDPPPSVQTATCLAHCILTESKYMNQAESLDMDAIKSDLLKKFSNDTVYAEAMTEAFRKCLPSTQTKMQAFKQIPLGQNALQRGCSPFAGMLLGCTYMEYFKNCPVHRWTDSPDCTLAKEFVNQCSLGA